jgi:hypothetical protein
MKLRALTSVALLSTLSTLASAFVVACGSSTTTDPAPAVTPPAPVAPAPTTPPDPVMPAPAPLDHGAISTTYPAFTPAAGQILTKGGAVLSKPVIITVTWPGETQATELENFGDTIGAGAYWKAITAEYGAAAAISGGPNHLRLATAAPASITDAQLTQLVADSLAAPGTVWPIPATGDPVYILYLPITTSLILQGAEACSTGVGGYHQSTMVNGKSVAFAIIPRCGGAALDETTFTASHELDEATTDPYPNNGAAFRGFRDEDVAWETFLQHQDEVGDACEFFDDSQLGPADSSASVATYTVQRQWSNASGAAGHDPCVPEFSNEVYFNVVPLGTEDIQVPQDNSLVVAKGFKVKAGEKRQIPLGFYSAGATAPWTIKAVNAGLAGGPLGNDITLSLDVTSGQNGQKAYLTVAVKTASATNTELVTIVSERNGVTHYMPFLIGN